MKPFALVSGVMAVAAFVREAAAQATPPVMTPAPAPSAAAPGDNSGILMALALMGALLLLVGIGVKIWDAKRKREAEAVHLQSQVSDALLREQDFFGLAITPTVHASLRRSAPMKIEVTGQAPSAALRDAALRIIRDEAARMGCDFEIDDHIEIRPETARRAA
jgi:hypothetical protein